MPTANWFTTTIKCFPAPLPSNSINRADFDFCDQQVVRARPPSSAGLRNKLKNFRHIGRKGKQRKACDEKPAATLYNLPDERRGERDSAGCGFAIPKPGGWSAPVPGMFLVAHHHC